MRTLGSVVSGASWSRHGGRQGRQIAIFTSDTGKTASLGIMPSYKVGYFIGSLSSTSINRELSKALIRLAPDDLDFHEIPIRDLPLYSQDYDANYPREAMALKDAIHQSQAILFIT